MKLPWTNNEDALPDRRVLLDVLHEEVDRQRASAAQRAGALVNRASVLVASAGILTGLQTSGSWSLLFAISVSFSAIAAVLGVLVLVPRLGGEVNIDQAEKDYWNNLDAEAIRNLTKYKLDILRVDESALKKRRTLLLLGFGALAASICFGSVHILLSAGR